MGFWGMSDWWGTGEGLVRDWWGIDRFFGRLTEIKIGTGKILASPFIAKGILSNKKRENMKRFYLIPLVSTVFLCLVAFCALDNAVAAYVVHGNYKSHIYHNAQCRYFNCKACTVVFGSAEEARENGYRACKICGG